jgi:hypothetical protein
MRALAREWRDSRGLNSYSRNNPTTARRPDSPASQNQNQEPPRLSSALAELSDYLRTYDGTPNHSYHCDSLIAALENVFRNNLFKFDDTFWKQILGTGMGVCPAPPWATIFFAILENRELPRWTQFIFLYKRFIDDIIGVWLHDPDPLVDLHNWNEFKAAWQTHHGLEWVFSERTQEVNFMDLTH